MFTHFCLVFAICITTIDSFQVTFRKNITLAPGEYYYINHTYDKEFEKGIIDYIDQISTNYRISLTYSYDNTPFDVFVLNQTEFECYSSAQSSAESGVVPPCSYNFLNSISKSFLLTTKVNNTLYIDNVQNLNSQNYIIVIDNTQFPKSLTADPYFLGAYQPLSVHADIYIQSNYELSELYYQVYLALLYIVIVISSGLTIFFVVSCYKYKVLQKKSLKLKKVLQVESN